jgi:hypothetical protein
LGLLADRYALKSSQTTRSQVVLFLRAHFAPSGSPLTRSFPWKKVGIELSKVAVRLAVIKRGMLGKPLPVPGAIGEDLSKNIVPHPEHAFSRADPSLLDPVCNRLANACIIGRTKAISSRESCSTQRMTRSFVVSEGRTSEHLRASWSQTNINKIIGCDSRIQTRSGG